MERSLPSSCTRPPPPYPVCGGEGSGVSIEYRAVGCSGRSCCLARRHMVWPEGTQLLCWLVLKMNVTPGPSIVRVRDFLTFY